METFYCQWKQKEKDKQSEAETKKNSQLTSMASQKNEAQLIPAAE